MSTEFWHRWCCCHIARWQRKSLRLILSGPLSRLAYRLYDRWDRVCSQDDSGHARRQNKHQCSTGLFLGNWDCSNFTYEDTMHMVYTWGCKINILRAQVRSSKSVLRNVQIPKMSVPVWTCWPISCAAKRVLCTCVHTPEWACQRKV